MERERERLLDGVRRAFGAAEQVRHYEEEAPSGPTQPEAWLLSGLPARGRVLDAGCGAGRVSVELARRGYDVVGADVSEPLLRAARAYAEASGVRVRFERVEPLRLPYADASFDAALSIKTLCYIPGRAARAAYLRELGRVLRPYGVMLLTQYVVPEESIGLARDEQWEHLSPNYTTLEPGDTFGAGEAYVHWFTPLELQEDLESSGLALEEYRSDEQLGGEGYIQLARLRKAG